jgi:UDP-3-O-[3-hydroxymyristoyl] glucosamine N-acyltransferase
VLRAETIRVDHADLFTFVQGDLESTATICHRPEETCPDSLVYLGNRKQLEAVASPDAAIWILHEDLLPEINDKQQWRGCLFSVSAIPAAMAALLKYFDQKPSRFSQWGERHQTAVVHPSAKIGANVMLGPYCVIGADSVIGDDCLIGSHAVVENRVKIGARTILHPHVIPASAATASAMRSMHVAGRARFASSATW